MKKIDSKGSKSNQNKAKINDLRACKKTTENNQLDRSIVKLFFFKTLILRHYLSTIEARKFNGYDFNLETKGEEHIPFKLNIFLDNEHIEFDVPNYLRQPFTPKEGNFLLETKEDWSIIGISKNHLYIAEYPEMKNKA